MGLHQNVAIALVALMFIGCIDPPQVDAQLCFYYLSSIRSRSIRVRSYYYYYRYYSYRCGWWGWRRCYGSYRVYVYYYYYYTAYNVYYIQKHYCCWGYSGANCDPICYNYCGHCSGCLSPYYCSCHSGWTGSTCCSDYNECYYNNGGCEQNCHNTVGSFYCSCQSGYTKSGTHCYDINECNSNNGGCSHDCHNTNGGYYCSCPSGYYLSGGKTCYDTNECASNNGGCEQNCINQPGTYHCTCNEGYDLSNDKHKCLDHNECTNGEASCNHHCVNTPGSYYCYCNTGYELDIDDETCIDTIECNSNNGGCAQHCTNTIGSYYCTCDSGYNLGSNDHACIDKDECTLDTHLCDHNCYNNIGSYSCDCKTGYYLDSDGLSCYDINECNTNNGGCNQTCVNEIGTYHCECKDGHLLDDDAHGCSDHDECGTNVHDCDTLAPAKCHNTHGSFYCTCPIGFRLNADGRTCDDIDECTEHSSGCSQICNNIYGSYFCTCHDGFSLDPDQHGCTDINECDVDDPCQSICYNLIGSYYCGCNTGYQLASDQHSCVGIPCDPQLEAPDNGGIACTGDQVTAESCTFSCRLGFELMGSKTRKCQTNSLWDGLNAYCKPLYCPKLQDPKNGYVATVGCTSYFESTCEVKCVDGYYIDAPTPYTETCSANEDNEVYWSPQYVCEYIPPCQSAPCQHGGVCYELSMTSYYCDCGDSLFTGLNCQTGIISVGEIPVLNVGDVIALPISGTPDSSITISVTVSSSAVNISQTSFTFDSNNPSSSFTLSASKPGIYSVSYTLSGDDADNYDTPPTSILIVKDPDESHVVNDYFLQTGKPVGILSEGCCSPGTQYQCPGGVVNTVSFSSNCAWDNFGPTEFSTRGVVFAKGSGLDIPISVTGVSMTLSEDSYDGFVLPNLSEECRVCDNLDPTCHYYDFKPNDYIDLLSTQALETTYLKAIDGLLPDWITVTVEKLDLTGQVAFGVDDFTSYLTTGENIYQIPGCEALDLEPDSLFAVLSHDKNISVDIDGTTLKYAPGLGDDPICFAVNLCKGLESPVHITIPSAGQDFISSYDKIMEYITSGWSITFKEFLVSDNGIAFSNDGHNSLSDSYWVGDSWVDSSDVVPQFDLRLSVNAERLFWEDGNNLILNMEFTGDVYHQSSPSGNDVEGLLSGDFTLTLNTTIEGKIALMTLLTTSTASLFTMPDYTSSSSAVPSGIAMNLNYIKHPMDEAIKNILPLPEGQDSCPVDVFIAFTSDKEIDYVRMRTNCLNANIGGYLYTGNFVHDIYLAGKSFPSTPKGVPQDTVLAIFSYLGDKEVQLNEFYSVQQPTSGDAAIICTFGRNAGSVAVTVSQAHLSILGTTFTTSLLVDSEGITFSSDTSVTLFGLYQATISGKIPLGTSWDDFVIELTGIFSDKPGSFVNNVQDYIYEFTDSLIEDSAERVKASEAAAKDAEFAQAQTKAVLDGKLNALNILSKNKGDADTAVTNSENAYNDAMNAYNVGLQTASSEALNAISLLKNVCMAVDVEWGTECVPASFCKLITDEEDIFEWGLKRKTFTENRLVHSVRDVTKFKWGIEGYCQILTLIRGWGKVITGHRCSYIHTYDNITEKLLDAYYENVDVSRTVAAVTESNTFTYSNKHCPIDTCAESGPEASYYYSDAACIIASQPVLESLPVSQDPVVQAYIALKKAHLAVSAANIQQKSATLAYNIGQNDYNALQSCLSYTDANLQDNIQKVMDEESGLQTLQATLQNANIKTIFSIASIEFGSDISADTNSLPVDITYNIAGATRTLTTSVEFTATDELINRAIAEAILADVGSYLEGSKKKRQAVAQPTFNEDQFQTRCGQLQGVKLYLEMIFDSLQNAYSTSMKAKTNITDGIAAIEALLTDIPTNYSTIDFAFLKNVYGFELGIQDLNTQLSVQVPVVNRTAALTALRGALTSVMSGMDLYYYRCWQNDLKKIHSMGLIDTVGHIRCHGIADCLNLVHEVVEDLLEDMPSSTTVQSLLNDIPAARKSLLSLALYNSTLDFTSALATNETGMYKIVTKIMDEQYWCTEIPTITVHPTEETAVKVGDTFTVGCKADSVLPVTYSFEKNGFLVATALASGVYTKTATELDSGLYQCFGTNAVGTVQSKLSNVIVYSGPTITLSPSRYETFEGDENGGFFACNATSYPEPMYEWEHSKDGSSWTVVDNSRSNELIVPKPTEEKQGWYHCRVSTDGSGMVRSDAAYLSIVRATFSKLSYSLSFMMNVTDYVPSEFSGSGEKPTPPTETVNLDYFKDQLDLTYAVVDDLHVDFSTDNKAIVVRITMAVSMNYSATSSFDEQAAMAYLKKEDITNGINNLQAHVKDGTFWFESEGNFFKAAHVSANLNDPVYTCPDNFVLAYSNFLCVTCSPGTYYTTINGKGMCSVCPETTYAEEDGQAGCAPCPERTDTLGTGSTWKSDCISYCAPGYYSENGLEECMHCPNNTYTLEYRSTQCVNCSDDDYGVIPDCQREPAPIKDVPYTTVLIPAVVGGIIALLVVVILVLIVIVVATKKSTKRQTLSPSTNQATNPLYVPPQDVLSLIPESEKTEYKVGMKEKEMEKDEKDIVNPLFKENIEEEDMANAYDDLDNVKEQMGRK